MVSDKKILKVYSYYKTTETLDPQGGTSLGPRGLIGMIYVRDH